MCQAGESEAYVAFGVMSRMPSPNNPARLIFQISLWKGNCEGIRKPIKSPPAEFSVA
jgi:hypothetical protein